MVNRISGNNNTTTISRMERLSGFQCQRYVQYKNIQRNSNPFVKWIIQDLVDTHYFTSLQTNKFSVDNFYLLCVWVKLSVFSYQVHFTSLKTRPLCKDIAEKNYQIKTCLSVTSSNDAIVCIQKCAFKSPLPPR